MAYNHHTPFTQAVGAVFEDSEIRSRYPNGMDSEDILREMRSKDPDAFPLCTILDVHDEMEMIYGAPTTRGADRV